MDQCTHAYGGQLVTITLLATQIFVPNAAAVVVTNTQQYKTQSPAYFNYHSTGRYVVRSRLECVAVCRRHSDCQSVNTQRLEDGSVECELQDRSTAQSTKFETLQDYAYTYPADVIESGLDIYLSPVYTTNSFYYQSFAWAWWFFCSYAVKSLTDIPFYHHDVACMLTCYEYDSCIYYNYDISTDTCRLCIHDDDQLFASGELQSDSLFRDDIQIKTDPSAAFRNHMCSERHNYNGELVGFNYTSGDVTQIDICYTLDSGYSGFNLYSAGAWVGSAGSCTVHTDHSRTVTWLFDPDEQILRVKYYFGYVQSFWVLRDIEIYTNKAIYGPVDGGIGTTATDQGYNFLGFVGWAGHVTDTIGSNFERC